MKKVLLSTAVAAVIASPAMAFDVSVGGYYNSMAYSVDSDNTGVDYKDLSFQEDAEIIFKGKTRSDTGIEYGFQVQLEASSQPSSVDVNVVQDPNTQEVTTVTSSVSSGDQVDEHYIYVKGGFGKIIVGSENSAAYLMQVSAPSFLGWKTYDNNFETWSKVAKYEKPIHDNYSADANKFTYVTPKVNGFQIGLSFTPSGENSGGAGAGSGNMLLTENASKHQDIMSYGVSYSGDMNGVKIETSYTYEEGEKGGKDDSEYAVGLQLGFGDFSVGGHYFEADEPNGDDWEITTLGVAYKMGATTIGLSLHDQEDAKAGQVNDSTKITVVGGSTKLTDGVKLTYSYEAVESDNPAKGDSDFIGVGLLFKF
jgi:outer membrane protein OmpU